MIFRIIKFNRSKSGFRINQNAVILSGNQHSRVFRNETRDRSWCLTSQVSELIKNWSFLPREPRIQFVLKCDQLDQIPSEPIPLDVFSNIMLLIYHKPDFRIDKNNGISTRVSRNEIRRIKYPQITNSNKLVLQNREVLYDASQISELIKKWSLPSGKQHSRVFPNVIRWEHIPSERFVMNLYCKIVKFDTS